MISLLPYLIYCDLNNVILYGVPNTFILGFASYHSFHLLLLHLIYFYIICYYLRIKIRALNDSLERRRNAFIILFNYHKLYKEIQDYNENFWSMFLLCIWLLLGALFIVTIFMSIFVSFNFIVKLIIIYGCSLYGLIFFFIIFTASSVQFEVKKSYKLLNKLYLNILFNELNNRIIHLKIKVRIS